MAHFKRNAQISKACALSATGLIPWWLISMLSLKYDHEKFFRQLKISTACLLVAGACFNMVCMEDASFFEKMRVKYFRDLPDEKIINFD